MLPQALLQAKPAPGRRSFLVGRGLPQSKRANRTTRQVFQLTVALEGPRGRARPSIAPAASAASLEVETSSETFRAGLQDAIARTQSAPSQEAEQSEFSWTKQWYPLALVPDLDRKLPYGKELLGQRLVLWWDRNAPQGGTWRCFQDKCPHRLAPLSEGRIEPSDGTLMCSYHGWRFKGDGGCTAIPQAPDAKALASACASPRSCAISHPTQMLQGMVWVWGEGGPGAEAEAARVPPLADGDMLEVGPDAPRRALDGSPLSTNRRTYRELPYGWDTLTENLTDPSHLPFSHHKLLGNRESGGHMEVFPDPDWPAGAEGASAIIRTLNPFFPVMEKRRICFRAPNHITWTTLDEKIGWRVLLSFYVIPRGPGRSALLLLGHFKEEMAPIFVKAEGVLPIWISHLRSNAVLDTDSLMLYAQERIIAQEQRDSGTTWRKSYYMPAPADRILTAYRMWLDARGGGVPPGCRLPDALPPLVMDKRLAMDRYEQHTRHCHSCSAALKSVERLRALACLAGVAALTALAVALGRGFAALPLAAAPAAAGAVAFCAAAWAALTALKQRFIFVDFSHALHD